MLKKNIPPFIIFFKYATVGVIGTLVDVGSLYIFVEFLSIPLLLATAMSFILAVINNFVLNKYWTFDNKSRNIRNQFIKFLIVSVIGLILTIGFMYLFVYIFPIPDISFLQYSVRGYIMAKLITSLLVLIWNFLGNKYWTFKDSIRSIANIKYFPFEWSIIIPALNEEKRIVKTLKQVADYFETKTFKTEIIVVDDGSTDRMVEVLQDLQKNIPNLRIVSYPSNKGKGYAVKKGVQESKGKYILFTDADNSTPIEEFEKVLPVLKKHEVVIGSRYIKGSNIQIKQPRYRIMLGRLGNKVIQWFLIDGVKDTQCGFKAFQHQAAKEIFARMKINRFGFDIELLAIARLLGYSIQEVPVNWYNSADSRVRPIKDALRTLKDLVYIKMNLWGGRYK